MVSSGVSTLAQALNQLERIREQQSLFATLSSQLTTGKKTKAFSGLGADILTSKRARADFATLETYINNGKLAKSRIEQMLNAVEEYKAQSKNFSAALIGLTQESVHQQGNVVFYDDPLTLQEEFTAVGYDDARSDVFLGNLKGLADNIFPFLVDLLNVRESDERYLLSGSQTTSKPLGNTGTLDTALSALIKEWKAGNISNDELISDLLDRNATTGNPNAITDTIIGYSSPLSSGNVGDIYTRVDVDSEVKYTALANEQAFRDILVITAFFKNANLYPIADTYTPPNAPPAPPDVQGAPGETLDEMKDNFFDIFNRLTARYSQSIDNIDQTRFRLENARVRVEEFRQVNTQQKNLLLDTIGSVEDVDLSEVAVKINTLQVQIEASYRVIASIQSLSLANFLR